MDCKIVIGGCRDYNNYIVFCKFVDMCLIRIRYIEKITIKINQKLFNKYKQTISDFNSYYSSFLCVDIDDDMSFIDSATCTKVLLAINNLTRGEKLGIELNKGMFRKSIIKNFWQQTNLKNIMNLKNIN